MLRTTTHSFNKEDRGWAVEVPLEAASAGRPAARPLAHIRASFWLWRAGLHAAEEPDYCSRADDASAQLEPDASRLAATGIRARICSPAAARRPVWATPRSAPRICHHR